MDFALRVAGKPIKAVVTDLDGTLFQTKGAEKPEPHVLKYIENIIDSGIFFAIATGRQYRNVRDMFGKLGAKMGFIVENGTYVTYRDETVSMDHLPRDIADELIADMKDIAGSEMMVSCADVNYTVTDNIPFVEHLRQDVKYVTEIINDYSEIKTPILKISINFPEGIPDDKNEFFHKKYDGRALVQKGGPKWLDIMPLGSGKGEGLKHLADKVGMDLAQTLTLGDSENDLEMMKISGLSLAMATGFDIVKENADAVVESAEEIIRLCAAQSEKYLEYENSENEKIYAAIRQLAAGTDWDEGRTERFIEGLRSDRSVRKEVRHFLKTGNILGEYRISGISLSDVIVWQVDHFKAYMDRHDRMNRYRQERLFLESAEVMLEATGDPEPFIRKFHEESGTDREDL